MTPRRVAEEIADQVRMKLDSPYALAWNEAIAAILPAIEKALRDQIEACAKVAVERAVQLGRQECCGFGQGSPPECCAQPVFMISDVEVESAIRAMKGSKP